MILVIDNYDSFVYMLAQYIQQIVPDVRVVRNDAITVARARRLSPRALVISPGPKTPAEAGLSNELIRHFAGRIPVLGVCLGHQCIAYSFGGRIKRARRIVHGKTSRIYHDNKTLYRGMNIPFAATRYHSLLVDEETLPEGFGISAWTNRGEIMGIRHEQRMLEGVQFHPESLITENGMTLLRNFFAHYRVTGARGRRRR